MKRLPASAILSQVKAAGPIEIIMVLCALTLIIVSHAVQIWALDKSFIPADEGYYMYLQATGQTDIAVRGHLIFRFFPILNDLFYNRVVAFIIATCGQLVLAYGFYRWVKSLNARCNFFVVWGLVCMFSLNLLGTPVLNYPILSEAMGSLAIGGVLWALADNKPSLLALSGFFLSLLIPIKITSLLIAPFLLAALLIVSKHALRDLIYSFAGFLIGLAFYVFIIETPYDVIQFIQNGFSTAIDKPIDPTHNVSYFLIWTKRSIFTYLQWIIMAYIIAFMPKALDFIPVLKKYFSLKFLVFICAALFILFYFWVFVSTKFYPRNFTGFLVNSTWVFAFVTTLYLARYKPGKYIYVVLMLLIAPLCITFGTDVMFTWKSSPRYICLLLALFTLIPNDKNQLLKWSLLLLLGLSVVNILFPSSKSGKYESWNEDVYANQTIPLMAPALSHPIKVDKNVFKYVNFYKENVPTASYTYSASPCFVMNYLLQSKMINDFRADFDTKHTEKCIKLLENNTNLYFLWKSKKIGDQTPVTENIKKYLDYFKKNGYNIIIKNQGDYHLAIVEPKNE